MNQKGFATILGLCLILVIALVVKGIQESEGNHAYETTDFQTAYDLQNAAESGICKAVKIVRDNPDPLPGSEEFPPLRTDTQHKIIDAMEIETLNGSKIIVDVWAERVLIERYEVSYAAKKDVANAKFIPVTDELLSNKKAKAYELGYAFFSVAELDNSQLYRRAFAYIVDNVVIVRAGLVQKFRDDVISEEEKKVIHFMNVASSGDYTYKD